MDLNLGDCSGSATAEVIALAPIPSCRTSWLPNGQNNINIISFNIESGMVIDDHLKIATVMNHLRGSIREHLLINSKPLTPWEDIRLLIDNFFSNSYIQQASRPGSTNIVSARRHHFIKKKGKGKRQGTGKGKPSSSFAKGKGKNKGQNISKGKGKGKNNNYYYYNNSYWNNSNYNNNDNIGYTNWNNSCQSSWNNKTTIAAKEEEEEKEIKAEAKARTSSVPSARSSGILHLRATTTTPTMFSKHYLLLINNTTSTARILDTPFSHLPQDQLPVINQEWTTHIRSAILTAPSYAPSQSASSQDTSVHLVQWSTTSAILSLSTSLTTWTQRP